MNKRIPLLLLLVLSMALLPLTAQAAEPEPPDTLWTDGIAVNTATAFSGGTGTAEDPYQLANAGDLAQLAVNVNAKTGNDASTGSTYLHKHFILTRDIDLAGALWVPIGGFAFHGSLDGQGHTIRRMTISTDRGPYFYNFGLFGSFNGEYLKNLTVKDSRITVLPNGGDIDHVGMLVGSSSSASVMHCAVKDSVILIRSAADVVGGFAGDISSPGGCRAEGITIRADAPTINLGGFAGGGSFSLPGNAVTGLDIRATVRQKYVGGFTGYCNGGSSCYARGSIDVPEADVIGGLNAKGADWQKLYYPVYSYAAVTIGKTTAVKYGATTFNDRFADPCYYDSDLCPADSVRPVSGGWPKTTAQLQTYHTAISLNNGTVRWTQIPGVNDGYPVFETGTEVPVCVPPQPQADFGTRLSSIPLVNQEGNTPGRWEWVNGEELVTASSSTYQAFFIPDDHTTYRAMEAAVSIITEDLWTDAAAETFAGGSGTAEDPWQIASPEQLAKLAADVNSGTAADGFQNSCFLLTADLDLSGRPWEPIGRNGHAFRGFFDGGAHIIRGMQIKTSAVPEITTIGLFGNIQLSDAGSRGLHDLVLLGSSVTADTDGPRWLGTLAGYATGLTVTRCGAEGTVQSNVHLDYFGGLIGFGSDADSCFFRGGISARSGSSLGGLMGTGSCKNSYVAAEISSADKCRPVSAGCTNCWFDSTLCPIPEENASGAAAVPTRTMKTYAAAIALNGSGGTAWTSTGADYPALAGPEAPAVRVPTGVTAMEHTTLAQVPLRTSADSTEGTWVWTDPETSVGAAPGERSFPAVFFPKDSRFAICRADIPVRVKKPVHMELRDTASTSDIEVVLQNAEAGLCIGAVYSSQGQLLSCGAVSIRQDQASCTVPLGTSAVRDGQVICIFLLNEHDAPQTAAVRQQR